MGGGGGGGSVQPHLNRGCTGVKRNVDVFKRGMRVDDVFIVDLFRDTMVGFLPLVFCTGEQMTGP